MSFGVPVADPDVPTAFVTAPREGAESLAAALVPCVERSDETDPLPAFADWLDDAVA